MSLRLDLVIRTSKRKKEARSPKQQRDLAHGSANTHGYTIVMEHDSLTDESGKTMDRAALHEVLRRVRADETDGVTLAMLDRLGRAPIEEAMAWVRELHAAGGVLVPADLGGRPVDLSDPQAETNLVLQLQIARQYWLTTQKRTRQSRVDAVEAGRYVGSAVPGFDKQAGRLVPNGDAELMESVFITAAASLRDAGALLRKRWPDGRWDVDRVRKLLASPAYKGWSVSGDLVNRRAHDRIVTEAQWEAAQQAPRERRSNGDYPLSGIAVCECGAPMVGQLKTHKQTRRQYRTMRCSATAHVTISADNLERHVRDWLRPLIKRGWFDIQFGDAELTGAQREVDRARAERAEFGADLEFQRELGAEGRRAQAAALRQAQEKAEAHLREVSGTAARANQQIPSEQKLETPEGLTTAARLAAAVVPIVVHAGRGPIERRVPLPKLDDGAGVLAA